MGRLSNDAEVSRAGIGTHALRCPVCLARFRGSARCSRCGADLTPLMRLAARSHALLRAAIDALLAGDDIDARTCAEASVWLRATADGRRLRTILALLDVRGFCGQ